MDAPTPTWTPGPTSGPTDDRLQRHIAACNDAILPGGRLRLRLGGAAVGWLDHDTLDRLAPALRTPEMAGAAIGADALDVPDQRGLDRLARHLAETGAIRWRDEPFDVRETPDGPVLGTLDRGALPLLGVRGIGVHLNGLVRRADGLHLWVGRRAGDKLLDPGKLDHLAAGGIPAGYGADAALAKEAEEECGLPPALTARAVKVADLHYAMQRPEGLRRDTLRCYDLLLPEDFHPEPVDGEVESFFLWPLERAIEVMRETDDFKFNVNLVLIDLGLRHGLFEPDEAARLRAGLYRAPL